MKKYGLRTDGRRCLREPRSAGGAHERKRERERGSVVKVVSRQRQRKLTVQYLYFASEMKGNRTGQTERSGWNGMLALCFVLCGRSPYWKL